MDMENNLKEWLQSGKYLPSMIRDFHDQKDLFKTIHLLYRKNDIKKQMPTWVQGHIYTIDWFLWYMASRGYTLQKSRKKVEFKPLESWRDWNNPKIKN